MVLSLFHWGKARIVVTSAIVIPLTMKTKIYILSVVVVVLAAVSYLSNDAQAKSTSSTNVIPLEVLLLDSPTHRIAEPTIPSRDSSTSLHPSTVEPVDNNPTETPNPE